jgi:hypothetical protein
MVEKIEDYDRLFGRRYLCDIRRVGERDFCDVSADERVYKHQLMSVFQL